MGQVEFSTHLEEFGIMDLVILRVIVKDQIFPSYVIGEIIEIDPDESYVKILNLNSDEIEYHDPISDNGPIKMALLEKRGMVGVGSCPPIIVLDSGTSTIASKIKLYDRRGLHNN